MGASQYTHASEDAPLLPTTSTEPVAVKVAVETEPKHHALLGMACVACSALCFSFMSTFIKYLTFTVASMEAIFWRSMVACACNFVVIKVTNQSLYVAPEYRKMLLIRCIVGFSSMGFAFYAVSQMVLADASVIIFTSPVFTFFMGALFLHEKIDPVSLISAIAAFGGLVCVVRPGFLFGYNHPTAASDGSWVAVCSGLLGALSQVFVFLVVRQLKGLNVFVIIHYFTLSNVLFAMVWIALIQQSFSVSSTAAFWGAVFGCGLFTFLGQSFLTRGFQLEKAGIASVMRYLDVVFVFIWDSFLLGEHINHWSVVGACIIVSCAVLIALRKVNMTATP
ncbi:Drug/Metabolite transporter (DMT) Superfamily [Phytophthora cinnamomi]|uniref:Drug/Metabolite transporter (DMT) Superfamily n=1 Tax=Phytophthora cinnamomi TaxID=4785 RepID=UPI003559A297|nr:Drug/Metabolite transporter (DMT) Superfamily [Phytophthora cinnamomi]